MIKQKVEIGDKIEIGDIYYTRSKLTDEPRIKEVLNTFRYLNSDAPSRKIITVTSGFSLKLGKINVIYGPSGSGKSTVLNKFKSILGGRELIQAPQEDDFLINLVGKDLKEAIKILTYAGLGEGNLFLRKFSQLSEGQKFRMRIALEIDNINKSKTTNQILYIDEFGSNLDPSTAKAIAHTFSIAVENSNLIVFVCCNNLDVARAFNYDTLISLGYDHVTKVEYSEENKRLKEKSKINIKVEKGDISHYRKFKRYHYLDSE
ncbi:AAA family ATPase, partial [Anoxybacillus sp. J5B_2022]|uniref:AAA family ATPase n=1 Tax=Anoxybacillus sp. J5B_2022 TaxID=3003246 RepID=UPI002286ACE7